MIQRTRRHRRFIYTVRVEIDVPLTDTIVSRTSSTCCFSSPVGSARITAVRVSPAYLVGRDPSQVARRRDSRNHPSQVAAATATGEPSPPRNSHRPPLILPAAHTMMHPRRGKSGLDVGRPYILLFIAFWCTDFEIISVDLLEGFVILCDSLSVLFGVRVGFDECLMVLSLVWNINCDYA
ncbi:5'-3' exonuclease family protein [Striga asiatica]|uniref:5'-3' exonuclease family protein n=1 Tax=Striga asiatica TaxID=4170 RepID=A0A5A7PSN9_STRAF|nr:5'-3' exonuclease family protein [Striga asiatica]